MTKQVAHQTPEVVTDAMIAAGVDALARRLPDVTDTTDPERLEVALKAVFVAMALAEKRNA